MSCAATTPKSRSGVSELCFERFWRREEYVVDPVEMGAAKSDRFPEYICLTEVATLRARR